ncbi:MAG: ribonuclease D [Candidatus Puniceispirillaceae bacterium]
MKSIDKLITTSPALKDAISAINTADFVAIDTEFMRESTYYPHLCLIQLCAGPHAFCVDPLAPNLDLSPLFDLMRNEKVTKVFHAGRQDLEIFVQLTGAVPSPVYDTQIAAMVCGLGDQVGYDKLVQHYKHLQIDKSSRFTNWSQRPLSDRQINYALDDVIHLAEIYPRIIADLTANGRDKWVKSELAGLADIQLYQTDPDTAYKRIKARNSKPAQVNRLAQLASWREREAQKRDVPRGRILRDDTLIDLAGSNPKTLADLKKIRGFPGGEGGKFGPFVIEVLKAADALPEDKWPVKERPQQRERPPVAVIEMLRVLLKHVTESHNVAPRLIASAEELEKLALSDTADIPAMQGWRREIFGDAALALKAGKLALTVQMGKTKLLSLEP